MTRPTFIASAAAALLVFTPGLARAVPPPPQDFLKPDDVIALVGGEDMVKVDEGGMLELFIRKHPGCSGIRIRNLAWEGDTVYAQPRMLNYPSLEQQLDEIGATVVLAQFGKMESLDGASKLNAFTTSYQSLIQRLRGQRGRRVFLLPPSDSERTDARPENKYPFVSTYERAMRHLGDGYIDGNPTVNERGERSHAGSVYLGSVVPTDTQNGGNVLNRHALKLIRAKNRLWHHYRRPQNWAFLAGDRTTQPSSRDHIDPNKRWFPEEMKEWLPLIEAKDTEIRTALTPIQP